MTNEARKLTGCEVLPPMLTPEETDRRQGQGRRRPQARRNSASCETRKMDKAAQDKDTPRGRQGNRFAVLNTFVDCTLATLPRTDALVWLVLFRDSHGQTAKSAQAYIAGRSGLCVRTVKAAIKRLRAAGLVDVVRRGGFRRGISVYKVYGHAP